MPRLSGLVILLVAIATMGTARPGATTRPAALEGSVVYVVDGDTIHVRIAERVEKVRYLGIDAPEVPHPRGEGRSGHERGGTRGFPHTPVAGDAARRVNVELVSGKHVRLTFDRERRDQYHRLLAYVWVGDRMINAEMVRRGYAVVIGSPRDLVHRALLLQLQDEARSAGRGLWQHSARITSGSAARPHVRSFR